MQLHQDAMTNNDTIALTMQLTVVMALSPQTVTMTVTFYDCFMSYLLQHLIFLFNVIFQVAQPLQFRFQLRH